MEPERACRALRRPFLVLYQPPNHRDGVSHVNGGHLNHLRILTGVCGGHLKGAAPAHNGRNAQGSATAVQSHMGRGQCDPRKSSSRVQRGRGRAAQQRQADNAGLEIQPPPYCRAI